MQWTSAFCFSSGVNVENLLWWFWFVLTPSVLALVLGVWVSHSAGRMFDFLLLLLFVSWRPGGFCQLTRRPFWHPWLCSGSGLFPEAGWVWTVDPWSVSSAFLSHVLPLVPPWTLPLFESEARLDVSMHLKVHETVHPDVSLNWSMIAHHCHLLRLRLLLFVSEAREEDVCFVQRLDSLFAGLFTLYSYWWCSVMFWVFCWSRATSSSN